ncbi:MULTISPECIES: replication initiation protein RepC [Asaia]|uniref:Replicator initiator RepC n=1 Tax=Asaia spathodeae TaxID=657016 RepID=A0ABX2P887_9PROT|nr:replication initiation protein RepC [Asaia spathodeae]
MWNSTQDGAGHAVPYRAGRRRLSAAMLEAQEELTTVPADYPARREVLGLLKSLRGALPVSAAAASTLIVMIEHTRAEDWTAMETPFVYAHNETLLNWTGISLATLRRHIRELAEARFLVAQDGRNGQRGKRWQGTESMRTGFNLASLRYRWTDLVALSRAETRRREELSFLRQEIASLNEQVRLLADALDQPQIMADARRLMRIRLMTSEPAKLHALHAEMAQLLRTLQDLRYKQSAPVDNAVSDASVTSNMTPMGTQNETHYTDTKNNLSLKKVVSVAACSRNRIEAMRREPSEEPVESHRLGRESALRGFRGTAQFYLGICSALREICPSARPTAEQLIEAAEYLSGQIGVSYHAWAQGCTVLGRLQAAVAVIVMASRLERQAVIYARDAYFRALVERGAQNALFLDRSLYALRDVRNREEALTYQAPMARLDASNAIGLGIGR